MRKLSPARVSHWDDFLISYRVYMMTGSFNILLFNGTFHVDKLHLVTLFRRTSHRRTKSHVQLDGEDPKSTEQMMIKTIVIIIIFSCMLTGIAKV